MLRKLTSFVELVINTFITTEDKINCFHCGEKSRRSITVYVNFDNLIRPVCCHGCAAVLKTIEELNMHQEYYDSRVIVSRPKVQQAKL